MRKVRKLARDIETGDWVQMLESGVCQVEMVIQRPSGTIVIAGGEQVFIDDGKSMTVCPESPASDQFPTLPMLEG